MNHTSREQVFQVIIKTRNFTLLEPFKRSGCWDTWTAAERELFAQALVEEGAQSCLLLPGGEQESFELAARVAPLSGQVPYLQGLAFWNGYEKKRNPVLLEKSIISFKQSVYLAPNNVVVVILLIRSSLEAFKLSGNSKFLSDIASLFGAAKNFDANDCELSLLLGEFFSELGKISGEVGDLKTAINFLDCVKPQFEDDARFAEVYVSCLFSAYKWTSDVSLLHRAEEILSSAMMKNPSSYAFFLHMGELCLIMFRLCASFEYMTRAENAFSMIIENESNVKKAVLSLVEMYCFAARIKKQIHFLRIASAKLSIGLSKHPEDNDLSSYFAYIQAMIGGCDENLSQIRQAEALAASTVESDFENPEYMYRLFFCKVELGKYFYDDSFFDNALIGLKDALIKVGPSEWIYLGLAQICLLLGEAHQSQCLLKYSLRFFDRCKSLIQKNFWFKIDWGVALMRASEILCEPELASSSVEVFSQIVSYYQSLDLSPDPELLYHYGCALDLQGDYTDDESFYDRAIQVLSSAQGLDSGSVPIRLAMTISLSHFAEVTGDVECFFRSMEHYQALSEMDVEDDVVWLEWGQCILNFLKATSNTSVSYGGNEVCLEDAEEKFIYSLRLGNLVALYYLSCLYAVSCEFDKALTYFELAANSGAAPGIDEIFNDDSLIRIRDDHRFKKSIILIEENNVNSSQEEEFRKILCEMDYHFDSLPDF